VQSSINLFTVDCWLHFSYRRSDQGLTRCGKGKAMAKRKRRKQLTRAEFAASERAVGGLAHAETKRKRKRRKRKF
jgi:hypothetical protein